MVIVDTSVWIEVFRRERPLDLEAIVPFDDVVTVTPVIQEVLQGVRDERAFRLASHAMWSLPRLEDPLSRPVFEQAIELYRTARRLGITIRSSVDCLIAACALRHGMEVLHRDRDYSRLALVSTLREREP